MAKKVKPMSQPEVAETLAKLDKLQNLAPGETPDPLLLADLQNPDFAEELVRGVCEQMGFLGPMPPKPVDEKPIDPPPVS